MESNLPSLDLDPSLKQAYEAAKDSKTITPILKEELKLTILSRRYKSGKGEINLYERKPQIKRELTGEEITKKLRRKEQNRRAAEKCRVKKKKLNDQLAIDFVKEQKKSNQLAAEVESLRREKEMLQRVLEEHAFTCARAVTPSPSYDDNTTFFNQGAYTCSTPCITNEMAGDPFDEYVPSLNQEHDNLMYSSMPFNETKGLYSTCTMTAEEFPEVQIPDDFADFSAVSPEMVPGRGSISDYLDEDMLNI